ncbi:uncharacterized protein EI90DRAFT_3089761 [Cantharellus anzutake]|uniref:uncharacterized protein n=1 Tax=Cantharellus anzutake TaxID=1750568 RepID=UPI0019035862|nr:uncharacterized protein EI90DRAFT_3089761 [Cantharellus anzutake]KAF8314637.1 hypothetical protein EI90DRAFT_3089761 [Cantharellus anzutake]
MFSVAFHSPQFIPMIFVFVLGGVYTTSLLANLHSRSKLLSDPGKNGISIELSHLPCKIPNNTIAVTQHVEGDHLDEGTREVFGVASRNLGGTIE